MATAEGEVQGELAAAPASSGFGNMRSLLGSPRVRIAALIVGAAALVAIMAGIWMWSQKPAYRVLFSNYTDRDGGAIIASLQQMNVPYKVSESGTAILIPSDQVHDIRLKLASQGLPRGGGVGFELMETQKLGISQFLEQVNFQRALEGEMARSIQSIGAVQSARVHLALPKASVFVRDREKPTASVLLNLQPGRALDQYQVDAIVHLVASAVPNLVASNVTVVDQNGDLLSAKGKSKNGTLDPTQIKYVQDLQESIVKRVESIIAPIVGAANVRAEATAEVDFSRVEQAAETYKPNMPPNEPSVRSQQNVETQTYAGNAAASGVPGALTNQPPVPATAPITTPQAGGNRATGRNAPVIPPINTHKDSTTNYEVDKTIRYTKMAMGGIKRLSVAVVVNYKKEIKDDKVTYVPLTEAEKTQLTDLVKEAMGFNAERGDSLNVVNAPFAAKEKEPVLPIWKRPSIHALALTVGKYILIGAVLLYIFFAFLRPMLRKISEIIAASKEAKEKGEEGEEGLSEAPGVTMSKVRTYEQNLEAAKQLARQDPKVVANVVKGWVGTNE